MISEGRRFFGISQERYRLGQQEVHSENEKVRQFLAASADHAYLGSKADQQWKNVAFVGPPQM